MILANGLYGHAGRAANPNKPKLPTPAQRRCVEAWATCRLTDITPEVLRTALAGVSAHPDAYTTGYSRPKSVRERLEAELATRS
jgi:hypothetical protein